MHSLWLVLISLIHNIIIFNKYLKYLLQISSLLLLKYLGQKFNPCGVQSSNSNCFVLSVINKWNRCSVLLTDNSKWYIGSILTICQVVSIFPLCNIFDLLPSGSLTFNCNLSLGFYGFSYVLLMHTSIYSMGIHLPIERRRQCSVYNQEAHKTQRFLKVWMGKHCFFFYLKIAPDDNGGSINLA